MLAGILLATSLLLSWTQPPGVQDSYLIFRATTGPYAQIATVGKVSTYRDRNAPRHGRVCYAVASQFQAWESVLSIPACVQR